MFINDGMHACSLASCAGMDCTGIPPCPFLDFPGVARCPRVLPVMPVLPCPFAFVFDSCTTDYLIRVVNSIFVSTLFLLKQIMVVPRFWNLSIGNLSW